MNVYEHETCGERVSRNIQDEEEPFWECEECGPIDWREVLVAA